MAKRGGGDLWQVLGVIGVVALMAYAVSGRGKNNSPLLPDAIEDPIDRVVAKLNQMFGEQWVTAGLNYLQSQMALAMPGAAAFVNAVHWVEQNYVGQPGPVKKQAALQMLNA
jgi:hypothetical protein